MNKFSLDLCWRRRLVIALAMAGLVFGLTGCGTDDPSDGNAMAADDGVAVDGLDEFGKPTLDSTGWEEPAGKSDAIQGRPGLPVEVDEAATAVWEVENDWSDYDTPAAREAGLAWDEDSGLTWEEKFHAWVDSFPTIDRDGHGETFLLQTPHGVELPAPSLECAEVSIFLRVAFASWYNLPFFMEARDANGSRLYFGHFGVRTDDGRYGNMANFKNAYEDYSHLADAIMAGEESWPTDSNLAGRQLPGAQDDAQPMIGDDAHTGAYLDQVFLNKRVGYFLMMNLIYFGSINLADSVNTYNITPEATLPGDTLLHRWQRRGIGHVMVVMNVDQLGDDGEIQLDANVASGSMPRRQPLWENSVSTKRQFTSSRAGGESYVDYNGGLKRWRTATVVNGQWTNVVPPENADIFISAFEKSRLAERPERYDELLTEIAPEDRLDAMMGIVEQQREHLRMYPASCAARDRRKDVFEELYEIAEEAGMSRAQVDAQYRELEDYVFAPLEYGESISCCWNSSTSEMYEIVMDYNIEHMADEESGTCNNPVVFKGRDDGGDGFELFRQYAEDIGKGDQWVDWSADENCPQQNGWVADVEQDHDWTPWCQLDSAPDSNTDGGGNDGGSSDAGVHSFSSDETIAIPDNDPEGITSTIDVDVEGTIRSVEVDLDVTHTYNGDLEITLHKGDASGPVYMGSGPGDDVHLTDHEVGGFSGVDAAGEWELRVIDTMAQDVGQLESWSLHLEVQ